MTKNAQFDVVVEILERMGIEVRVEPLDGGSPGYCELRGRKIVFLDEKRGDNEELEACLQAIARQPETDEVYLPPAVREAVERIRRQAEDL